MSTVSHRGELVLRLLRRAGRRGIEARDVPRSLDLAAAVARLRDGGYDILSTRGRDTTRYILRESHPLPPPEVDPVVFGGPANDREAPTLFAGVDR